MDKTPGKEHHCEDTPEDTISWQKKKDMLSKELTILHLPKGHLKLYL